MTPFTDKTLAEHLRISDSDIIERKSLLGITADMENALGAFQDTSELIAVDVVEELYAHQVTVPAIGSIIGDSDTLSRLKSSMCTYIVQLFSGSYGADYVNARLRIGKVHARIGVAPHLYVSTVHRLQAILSSKAIKSGASPLQIKAVHKMILFDLQLVFDTYIQGLVSEVELGRDKLMLYAETLETKVAERTAEISEMARTDELTGLLNRREFFDNLRIEMDEVRDHKGTLALIFMDVDEFKYVNDTRGHVAGDRLLRAVGMSMRTALIGKGMGYRYGGDEFCAVLRNTTQDEAEQVVAEMAGSMPADLTLSYGISILPPGSKASVEEFVKQADQAMFAEKGRQRNVRSA